MENKIWDILENVRQGYITVNDGTQQVLDLLQVVQQSEQLCQYEPDNTTAMNCKHCGDPKWVHKCCSLA
jgi:hypothetical protein